MKNASKGKTKLIIDREHTKVRLPTVNFAIKENNCLGINETNK
jgi:hypothetical protein